MRGSSNNPPRIVLLGPPGAGKGTQSELLCARLAIPHISTGDLLREAQHAGSRLGKLATEYIDQGKLLPDPIINGVVEQRISALGATTGFLLDGFPRTIPQAERLTEFLGNMGGPLTGTLYYDCPEDELIRRLSGRRVCDGCGRIYHFTDQEAGAAQTCSVCGGKLYRREDDSPTAIRTRLKIYRECTQPLADYYERRRLLFPINAVGDVEEIYLRSLRALGIAA